MAFTCIPPSIANTMQRNTATLSIVLYLSGVNLIGGNTLINKKARASFYHNSITQTTFNFESF